MIAMQEMLMQEVGDSIYLFPAWPLDRDIRFRLHASDGTTVEAELRGGKVVSSKLTPAKSGKRLVKPKG